MPGIRGDDEEHPASSKAMQALVCNVASVQWVVWILTQ